MITKDDFNALQHGRKVIDGEGIKWKVLSNRPSGQGDFVGEKDIVLQSIMTGDSILRRFSSQYGIIDKDMTKDNDFNHKNAHIV